MAIFLDALLISACCFLLNPVVPIITFFLSFVANFNI